MLYHTATFLVGAAHIFGVPVPKLQTFSETIWALHIDYSQYEKTIPIIFAYLFILQNDNNKNFRF